jgi:formylglycine-generating enzyme required for sulfatase activity
MSYARFDDENDGAYLTDLRERLSREVRAYTGRPFHIFQDTKDIPWGQPFAQRIDTALATITFFIPILTPSFFQSEFCCSELEKFLAREAALGRSDLVLPVYYISVPALEDLSRRVNDPLAQTIAARQRMDWRELRFERFDSPRVRRMLAQMAEQIAAALEQLPALTSPPEAASPPPSPPAPPAGLAPDNGKSDAPPSQENGRDATQPTARATPSPPTKPARERPHKTDPPPERRPTAETHTRPRRNRKLLPVGALVALLVVLLFFAVQEWPFGDVAVVPPTATPTATITPPAAPTTAPITTTAPGDPAVVELPNGVTMEFVAVPAGPFLMGSSDDDELADDDEKPQHELTLDTYWIGKTEVTNAQFRPFVEGDGYTNRDYWTEAGWQWKEEEGIVQPRYWDDAEWNGADQPVVGISWYEAVAYARWLSAQTGQALRLPTEAEWEKAARGPDGLMYPWGDAWEEGRANTEEAGIGKTTPVGSYPEGLSPYGALDMAGNVWEWTATKWRKDYPYTVEDEWTAEYLAGDNARMLRGGSWFNEQKFVRGADRPNDGLPRDRGVNLGLRLARHSPLPGSNE